MRKISGDFKIVFGDTRRHPMKPCKKYLHQITHHSPKKLENPQLTLAENLQNELRMSWQKSHVSPT